MPFDPLSQTTRYAKRNLLIASMLAITYRAFDVTIEKLPLSVIVIDFNKGVFAFLLTVVLIYFLVLFAIYFFIDIKNIEKTSHEKASAQRLGNDMVARAERFAHKATADANEIIGGPYQMNFTDTFQFALREYLSKSAHGRKAYIRAMRPNNVYILRGGPAHDPVFPRTAHQQAYEAADKFVIERFPTIVSFERAGSLLAWTRYRSVGGVYVLRSYGLDGLLPLALGVIGVLAMYQLVSFDWLRHVAPP